MIREDMKTHTKQFGLMTNALAEPPHRKREEGPARRTSSRMTARRHTSNRESEIEN